MLAATYEIGGNMKKGITILFILLVYSFLFSQINFNFVFSFEKIHIDDEFTNLQLFDFDNDGIKEIYATFTNTDEEYYRVLGVNSNGNIFMNEMIDFIYSDEISSKIQIFKSDTQNYISIASRVIENGSLKIKIRIHELYTTVQIDNYSYSLGSEYGGVYSLNSRNNNEFTDIFVGVARSDQSMYGGAIHSKLLKLQFDSANLSFLYDVIDSGKKIYPNSNLTFGYYDWWDDLGGEGEYTYFNHLENNSCFFTIESPRISTMLTSDDGSYEEYGTIIYYASDYYPSGKMVCYTNNYSNIAWELPITLHSGSWNSTLRTASSNIEYEGEDYFMLLFNFLEDTVNILDRLTGEIIYSEYSNLEPFLVLKTNSNELILFENNENEYLVYTNDPNYFTNIEENEILQSSPISLIGNFPNPFNPSTTIEFSVQNHTTIELSIYNTKGQKIKTLVQSDFAKGSHSIVWNGNDELGKSVSSGVYLYKLNINGKTVAVKKCLMLK